MHQKRPLCFLHIPKTAGTSLTALLRIHWCEDAVMPQLQANFHANHPIWSIVAQRYSAFGLGMHLDHERIFAIALKLQRLGHSPLLLTMLRDPVERIKSRYREWRGTPSIAYQHSRPHVREAIESAKHLSFQDFILSDNAVVINTCDNLQARLLAGQNQSRILNATALVDLARQHLSHYHIVGRTEDYKSTVTALSAWYGWVNTDNPSEEHRLHQSQPVDSADMRVVKPESVRRLEAYTELDQQLYNLVQSHPQHGDGCTGDLKGDALYEPRELVFVPAHFTLHPGEPAKQADASAPKQPQVSSQDQNSQHPGLATLRAIADHRRPHDVIGLGKKKWPELIGYTADPKHRSDQSLLVLRFHSLNHQMSRIRNELAQAHPSLLALSEVPPRDFRLHLMSVNPMFRDFMHTQGEHGDTALLLDLSAANTQLGEDVTLRTINLLAHCFDSHPANMAQLEDSEPNRLYALSLLSHCNHLQMALDEAVLHPEKTLSFSRLLSLDSIASAIEMRDLLIVSERTMKELVDDYTDRFLALYETVRQYTRSRAATSPCQTN